MKRRFTEDRIINILKEQEVMFPVKEITHRYGIVRCGVRSKLSPYVAPFAQGIVIQISSTVGGYKFLVFLTMVNLINGLFS